jgi:hypothetical protein
MRLNVYQLLQQLLLVLTTGQKLDGFCLKSLSK